MVQLPLPPLPSCQLPSSFNGELDVPEKAGAPTLPPADEKVNLPLASTMPCTLNWPPPQDASNVPSERISPLQVPLYEPENVPCHGPPKRSTFSFWRPEAACA